MLSKDSSGKVEGKSSFMQGKRIGGAQKALGNGRYLSMEYARSLDDGLFQL